MNLRNLRAEIKVESEEAFEAETTHPFGDTGVDAIESRTVSERISAGCGWGAEATEKTYGRGRTIRRRSILLLAPTTTAARERANEIRDVHFDQMVERNIQRLRYLAGQLTPRGIDPARLQVRLYDQLPEISVHQMDDRVLVGFLPYRRRSSMTTQLETERHAELGIYAVAQFERLWNRARLLDGLRYVILRTGPAAMQSERLLLRAWKVGDAWYLASARVEELLGRRGVTGPSVRTWIEKVPAITFYLSEPLTRQEHLPVWDTFARIYSAADPGVPIRALTPEQ